MDVISDTMGCDSIIDSFMEFYGNLNRAGWAIRILENGWQFVNVSLLDSNDGILSIPWPSQRQIPGRWNTSPSPPRSPSPVPSHSFSPISLPSTEEFVPRSGSGDSVSSRESDSLPQSPVRWYTMPTTPPERKIPDLLFRQAPPKLVDCRGCEICDNTEMFPNAMWSCGHMVCQSCVINIEESGLQVRCPFCRESGQYYVGRLRD